MKDCNVTAFHSSYLNFSILCVQVHQALVVERMPSTVSSHHLRYGNSPVNLANFVSQVVSSTRHPVHRGNALHCSRQGAWPAICNLRVLLLPRSRNRELHQYPIQAHDLLFSIALSQSGHAFHRVRVLLHLDQIDRHAIHQLSIAELNTRSQVFLQGLFFRNKAIQPSNEELPHFSLLNGAQIDSINYLCQYKCSFSFELEINRRVPEYHNQSSRF